jgi:S-adenosylmethionine decarboxylase
MDYGNHIILDLHECDESKLFFSTNNVLSNLDIIIKNNNGNILSSSYHIFPNDAYTIVILLAESHLSIHTFPENKYASVDVYTCGMNVLTFNIATSIIQYFNSMKPTSYHIIRNNFKNQIEVKYNANDYIIRDKEDKMILLSNVKIISNMKNITILQDMNNNIISLSGGFLLNDLFVGLQR